MPATDHLSSTFGVEIECYLPEGATAPQAAAAVGSRLGAPCHFEGYNHHTRSHWKVVTDGSLGDVARGIEFVSPILIGAAGLQQVETVCRALADFGCTVSKKCGLHVHVGVGVTPGMAFFRNLVKLYSTFEPVLDSIMPPSRRASNNLFCRSMTAAQPSAIDAAMSIEAIQAAMGARRPTTPIQQDTRRYYKINLQAFARHHTVEFRQHSATLDATKARAWTVLCLRMVAAAKDGIAIGSNAAPLNAARPGSKAHRVGEMLLRPEGVTGREVCAALNWPSVSMPQQARICGLEFTTQRTGREVRYFAVVAQASTPAIPVTIDGFAQLIGADETDRQYMNQRAADLGGAVQWAA